MRNLSQLIENEIKLSDSLQTTGTSIDYNMRRLEIASNAGAMSVDLSKEKNSPNLEGSSSMLQRSNQNNNGSGVANDARSPLGHL